MLKPRTTSSVRQLINAAIAMATVAVAFVSALIGPASAQGNRRLVPTTAELQAQGLEERAIKIGETERWFLVRPARDKSRPAPVLLVLHGGTQSMRHLFSKSAGATRGWPELANRENAILLVPNGVNSDTGSAQSDDQTWNDLRPDVARQTKADDVKFLLALLDWASSTLNVDRTRIYVTGASNGGMMTFRLLMEAPERFAAGAAFVAALPVESARFTQPKFPTPLLIVNGTLDPLIAWNGGTIPGNRGQTRSIPATVNWWLEANKATKDPTEITRLQDTAPDDNCRIERRVYGAEPGGATVETYTLIGGGHAIPSAKYPLPDTWIIRRFIGNVCRDAEGIELAWAFLSKHRRTK